jgi:membrane associated rhomboid family serine protease
MLSLRGRRHPFAPVVLVILILPAAVLMAPPPMRAGLLLLLFLLGSPVAAIAGRRALRRSLAQIPVPERSEQTYREAGLERWLRALLTAVPPLGAAAIFLAVNGIKAWRAPPPPGGTPEEWGLSALQSTALAAAPLLFLVLGVRLWRDLLSARLRRAEGLAPLPAEPASATGDPGLDRRLPKKGRTAFRLGVFTLVVSALANVLPPRQPNPDELPAAVLRLAKVTAKIEDGEPYRFVTATFVHGEFAALAVGLLAFIAVAPLVEALLGGFWLAVTFVGGGFAATVASYAFMPGGRIYMGMTGAVAAQAGLLLFLGVLQRRRLPPAALRRIGVRVGAVAVILAFASALLPHADVAAHLGGFTFGAVLALFARPQPAVREAMEAARAEAQEGG